MAIQLDSFTILFQTTKDWMPTISKVNKDTAILEIDYTGRIGEFKLTIGHYDTYDSILIEQKFENALTLMNMEERFVHLKKWWKLDANWQKIPITTGVFKMKEYDKTMGQQFKESLSPQFKEIKSEALKYKTDTYYAPIIRKSNND